MNRFDKENALLLYLTERKTRKNGLTPEQTLAVNWFRRDGVPARVIAKAFGKSRNTIHYKLRNEAVSYPKSEIASATAARNLVDLLGMDEIYRRFVTPEMEQAIKDARVEVVRRLE